eukprot:CAMPEP_0183571616 /NCGR_PEP_ID=MMETSP0371-20130417/126483_1 /TAXON_ID=268820 /ORGANISM="Peridinium aciculiferum, Strain PAER-2" /LENGTH=55 /DNA_ID=CAMNT_0025781401 /DNA_START=83 /DNA_END=247 /DNA_ORIENTATION=+
MTSSKERTLVPPRGGERPHFPGRVHARPSVLLFFLLRIGPHELEPQYALRLSVSQ